ncbi:hypothetical protein [Blautia sp. MSJ-19]|uniref:hypothetical protein n=1 Tax=Blautia sp. MSJ-19 TaxID=2841517 RepID=UPI001C0EBAA6|nr:hypothetical protein [Blautia sp. MSJ-19]MBU5479842.1 hypothetical protein [Blautia sp. MSJ-19]
MKKLFAISTAIAIALSVGVTAFADSGGEILGVSDNQSINVIAKCSKYIVENQIVYSVDMKWDDMTFTWCEKSSRVWNPEKHTYSGKVTGSWDKNTANIQVTNHSNAGVRVDFVYKPVGSTNLSGTLSVTEDTLTAGVENDYEHADKVTSRLTISGKPNQTVSETGTRIGTITITVSPETSN